MRISKLLGALGNLDQIAEGIKNKIFKRDDVEAVAKVRWLECKVCPLLDTKGDHCAVNGTQRYLQSSGRSSADIVLKVDGKLLCQKKWKMN